MSLNLFKTSGVQKFNGDSEKFPMFKTQFMALVFSMGQECAKAVKGRPPYADMQYEYSSDGTKDDYATKTARTSQATPRGGMGYRRAYGAPMRSILRSPIFNRPSQEDAKSSKSTQSEKP